MAARFMRGWQKRRAGRAFYRIPDSTARSQNRIFSWPRPADYLAWSSSEPPRFLEFKVAKSQTQPVIDMLRPSQIATITSTRQSGLGYWIIAFWRGVPYLFDAHDLDLETASIQTCPSDQATRLI